MAKQFSPLVGFPIEAIWHTAVVAHGKEWFFGSNGVEKCDPKTTMLGDPKEIMLMGQTHLSKEEFTKYMEDLSQDRYQGSEYKLLDKNCNNFSEEVCQHLTKKSIPKKILDLPEMVKTSPMASMLLPIIEAAKPPTGDEYVGATTTPHPGNT